MKLIVAGNLIDTELIYLITPISSNTYSNIYFRFKIRFLNRTEMLFKLYSGCYLSGTFMVIRKADGTETSDHKNGSLERIETSNEYIANLKKITELRKELIKYWSNNQSSIPKLELDNLVVDDNDDTN